MLTINASSLRTSSSDAPGHAAGNAAAANPATDPAGFASLLRQTQAVPIPAAPTAAESTPSARETAKPDAAPNEADAPNESNEPAQRNRASLKGKLRPAEGTLPAPGDKPAKPDLDDPDDTAKLPAIDAPTERCDAPQTRAVAGESTLDPTLMQWLAGLQRPMAVAIDDAPSRADSAKTPLTEALGSPKAQRAAEPKADADLKDKATQARDLRDETAVAREFAGVVAEQRVAERPAQLRLDTSLDRTTEAGGIGANALAPAPNAGTAAVASVAVPIATPLGAPDFAEALGLRLAVLAKDGVQTAELHLNPADMGPVSVQIVMDGTQARVDFGADVAATRQAIEAGLPELASALADAGFTLAGGGVSQHAGGRGSGSNADSRSPEGRPTRALAADDDTQQRITAAARRVVARGGIDLFA